MITSDVGTNPPKNGIRPQDPRRVGIGSGHRIHTQIGGLHLRNFHSKISRCFQRLLQGSVDFWRFFASQPEHDMMDFGGFENHRIFVVREI